LVVPIGNNSLYNKHFEVVSRLKDMPFYELNKPNQPKNYISPFKNFDWSDGNILYEFLRYDRVPYGAGDLDNFQVIFYNAFSLVF
jgi:hypothetical protein